MESASESGYEVSDVRAIWAITACCRDRVPEAAPLSCPLTRPTAERRPELVADQRGMVTKTQTRIAHIGERGDPQLLQPPGLRPHERLACHVGERRSTPQPERLLELPQRCRHVIGLQRRPRANSQSLKPPSINGIALHPQLVSAGPREKGRARSAWRAIRLKRTPQLRNEHLKARRDILRRPIAPQDIDQPIPRDHVVRLNQQSGEQRTLLERGEMHRAAIRQHLKRPQYPILVRGRRTSKTTLHPATRPWQHNPAASSARDLAHVIDYRAPPWSTTGAATSARARTRRLAEGARAAMSCPALSAVQRRRAPPYPEQAPICSLQPA